MTIIPAFCEACGRVFNAPIFFSGVAVAHMSGNTVSCPYCGAGGRIPDGIYNILGDTVRVVSTTARSAADLRALIDALNAARAKNATPDEAKTLIKERAPELALVADALPKNPGQFWAAVSAIAAVLSVLVGAYQAYIATPQGITKDQVEEIVSKALSEKSRQTEPTASKEGKAASKVKRRKSPKRHPRRRKG